MNQIFASPAAAASLDLDVLRSIVAIAETGSVTAAAERVGRTPAAISMQLKKLEETLGRALFERTRQGMNLTAEGERLMPYANRMVDLNREALEAFRAPELTGSVSVGMIDSFGGVRLGRVLAAFARSHPKVAVDVSMSCSNNLGPRLDRCELDISLITPGGSVAWRDTDIVLHEEPLAWIACEGGRAIRQTPLPLAVANEGCAWRKLAMEAVRRGGLTPRIAYISDYDAGQLAAAEADLAIAPMPRSYLHAGLVELGAKHGLPPLGRARIAMRLSPQIDCVGRALAERIAESYGVSLDSYEGAA